MGNVSMSYLFSFSRYQTKCVIKFLFRQLMTSQTNIYLGSSCKAMADREKREGKMEIQKLVEIIMPRSSVDFLKVELRNIYTKRLPCLADFGR